MGNSSSRASLAPPVPASESPRTRTRPRLHFSRTAPPENTQIHQRVVRPGRLSRIRTSLSLSMLRSEASTAGLGSPLTTDAPASTHSSHANTTSTSPTDQPASSDVDMARMRPGEDQAAMISRLLSAAASATAASLVGHDERAIQEAQDVAETALPDSPSTLTEHSTPATPPQPSQETDGSFDSFLRNLQSGRLAAALRNGGNELGGGSSSSGEPSVLPMNFFRMFRFGRTSSSGGAGLIPVIIVGIRSVTPATENGNLFQSNGELGPSSQPTPPILDALSGLPFSVTMEDEETDIETTVPSSSGTLETSSRGTQTVGPSDAPSAGSGMPATTTSGNSDNIRSWIIYVLGGSYPESHPILTTPSLFTDSPTYEDMLLLSSILGPVKPPVASTQELDAAGGVFSLNEAGKAEELAPEEEQCLVCLSHYVSGDSLRRLKTCAHVFHKDCIDEWLLTGRNSCPLCRHQGVDSIESTDAADTSTSE